MRNNFCEESNFHQTVLNYHDEVLSKMEIPSWMNLKCPFCHKEQPLRSIRAVTWKLNARNCGDIAVEVFCHECSMMDTMYFRSAANTMKDFIACLLGDPPKVVPVLEEDMYRADYNNITEKMLGLPDMKVDIKEINHVHD